MPTMQAEATGRLDAVLGRPRLDAPDEASSGAREETGLWLDQESGAAPTPPVHRHKGSHKGSSVVSRRKEKPDLSSDRAETGGFGTAYRIPGEMSHVSQPRSRSTSKRHMRRMRQDP
jgi:hypothetical protein